MKIRIKHDKWWLKEESTSMIWILKGVKLKWVEWLVRSHPVRQADNASFPPLSLLPIFTAVPLRAVERSADCATQRHSRCDMPRCESEESRDMAKYMVSILEIGASTSINHRWINEHNTPNFAGDNEIQSHEVLKVKALHDWKDTIQDNWFKCSIQVFLSEWEWHAFATTLLIDIREKVSKMCHLCRHR